MELQRVKDIIPNVLTNKYARWAANLTMSQVEALLTLIGEHCIRSHSPMTVRREGGVFELDPDSAVTPGERRKAGSYNALLQFHRSPDNWNLHRVRKSIMDVIRLDERGQSSKVKVLSLTSGTYDNRTDQNNSSVELAVEVNGYLCCLSESELPLEAANTLREWLAERLGYPDSRHNG